MPRRENEDCEATNLTLSRKQYAVGSETLSEPLKVQTQWQKAQEEAVQAQCEVCRRP